jgi:adenylate cyclase
MGTAGVTVRRLFPAFPRELEAEFQRTYNLESVRLARITVFLGTVIYLGFHFWDRVIDVDHSGKALAIRFLVSGCLIPIGLLPLSTLSRYLQRLMMFALAVAGLGISAIIVTLHDGLNVGLSGIILVMMFNFGFARLLFIPSLVSGIITCIGYNVAAVLSQLPAIVLLANDYFLVAALVSGGTITYLLERLFRSQFLISKDLELERARTEALVQNLLPLRIANRLKAGEKIIAESHGEATVLFADLVGFTSLTKRLSPGHLVEVLNEIFSLLDELTERHGVEKIKTIGDAYMVVAGAGVTRVNTASGIADFALDMVRDINNYAVVNNFPLALRVGISTGQVISGVIGTKKLSFDLWGDTVNLASRMESNSGQGQIQVSETTYWRLHGQYEFSARRRIAVEGMGEVETYFLLGKKLLGVGETDQPNLDRVAKPG